MLDHGLDELDLSGWWHTHFEACDDAPSEGAPAPRVGWARLEHEMESRPVPGTWPAPPAGHCLAAWQWRPFLVPEEWAGKSVWLRLGGFGGRLDVYIDGAWRATARPGDAPLALDLTALVRPGASHELTLRLACCGGTLGEDTPASAVPVCGLWGSVSLLALAPGGRPALRPERPPISLA